MGKGIEAAKLLDPENVDLISLLDDLKDQLIIVLIKRLGGKSGTVRIGIPEMDDTGMDVLSFSIKDGGFVFRLGKKE